MVRDHDSKSLIKSMHVSEPAREYSVGSNLQLYNMTQRTNDEMDANKSIYENVTSHFVTSSSGRSRKLRMPTPISRIPTPGKRPSASPKALWSSLSTDSGLGLAGRSPGIANELTPRSSIENKRLTDSRRAFSASMRVSSASDGNSGLNRTNSNSSLSSVASSVASVSSLLRDKSKPPTSDQRTMLHDLVEGNKEDRRCSFGSQSLCSPLSSSATSTSFLSMPSSRMASRLGVPMKISPRIKATPDAPARETSTHKVWPATAPSLAMPLENFTCSEQALMLLKEDHEATDKGVQELLSYVSSSSSSMALTPANMKARKEETMLLKAGIRRLSLHTEGLMQCCNVLERNTLEQKEYMETLTAEIERLTSLVNLEKNRHMKGSLPGLELEDLHGDESLSRPSSDSGTASTSSSQNIFSRLPRQESERQRHDLQQAMQEDSPLSAYVQNILKKATEKIEDKWRTRFAEQFVEHEQALAQERERSSASVLSSSRLVTETLHGKDDELKAIQELNIKLNQQIRQLDLDLDATRSERDFFKQQMEDDDDRSSSAHSFWEKTTDLAKQNRNLTEDLSQANRTIVRLNETIKIMKTKASSLKNENGDRVRASKSMVAEKNLLQDKLAAMELKFEDEKNRREQFQVNLEQLTVENTALYAQMVAQQTTYEAKMEELQARFEKRNVSLVDEVKLLQDQNRLMRKSEPRNEPKLNGNGGTSTLAYNHSSNVAMHDENENNARHIQELTDHLLQTRRELLEKSNFIAELELKAAESEAIRRKLHNTIQELRGNIRVHVRLRPFLRSDGPEALAENPESAIMCDTFASTITTNVDNPHTFAFDKIYGQSDSQEFVFKDVSDFIQSAMDGYNVCIFAYGQTGSGKTHTMQGSGKAQMRGIIPRSIGLIINCCEELTAMGWNFSLMVTFYEIYNETIRDLLTVNSGSDAKHNIRTDNRGRNYVDGLTEVFIDFDQADEQVDEIVNLAACNRSVDRTDMNALSSRSHSIFALKIRGYNEAQNTEVEGTLSLVDLAGSERLSRSRATGDRLKEAQAINKSLSALADVFQALAKKSSHVPYRNSKLTFALQPALSGEGKTLMMANLSPTFASLDESLCSMRFAHKVSRCELGTPLRQIKTTRRQSLGTGDLARNGVQSTTSRESRRSTLTPGMLRKLV